MIESLKKLLTELTPVTPIKRRVHVVCSPYKTGSSSVEQALVDLGVGTKPMVYNQRLLQREKGKLDRWTEVANKIKSFSQFEERHANAVKAEFEAYLRSLRRHDIFADAPFGHTQTHPYVRKILAPKAVHIWVHRPFPSWSESVRRWEMERPEIYSRSIRMWETDVKQRRKDLRRLWNVGYRNFQRITEAFPQDSLELDLESLTDYSELAAFYGVPAPQKPFPRRNVNS